MSDFNRAGYADLSSAEYLLDPPESVWEGVLSMDHATWLEIKDLDVIERTGNHVQAYGRDLTREAWLGLYSSTNPIKGQPPDGMEVTHSIFDRAQQIPEWNALRSSIVADEIAAAFGAAHFARELIDKLPPEVKEKMEESQRVRDVLNDLQTQIQAFQMMAEACRRQDQGAERLSSEKGGNYRGSSMQELEEKLAQIQRQKKGVENEARALTQQAVVEMEKAKARTDQALVESLSNAGESLSDLKTAAREFGFGWSLGGGAGATRAQLEGLQELANYLKDSKQLKKIMDLLGWAKRMVSAERRKSRYGRESFTHYQVQELELESIAPEELVGLMEQDQNSVLWLDFLRRSLDGELLHRRYEGEDEAGRGPLVMLIDKSGSMCGWPNATACAMELALMQLAIKENRRFVAIPFSDTGQYQVYDPGIQPDLKELVRHLELFYGGGTEPYAPLTKAMELIKSDPGLNEGDILIITDGIFGKPPDEFMEFLDDVRDEPGMKIVAVVINGHPGQADFADKVVQVNDLYQEREKLAEAVTPLL